MAESSALLTSRPGIGKSARTRTGICFRPHADLPWLTLPEGMSAQLALDIHLARVPNVKPWLRGVLNLRSSLIAVFDIALWLGLEAVNTRHFLITDAIGVLSTESPGLLPLRTRVDGTTVSASLGDLVRTWFDSDQGPVGEFDPGLWLRQVAAQLPGAPQ